MRRVFASMLLAVFVAAAPAAAQVQSRPTDAPIVTADNESWYVGREPIQFAGDVYYPAGASVFFDGNKMVRSGHFEGVPLYSDTTIEPFSVVYVPVSRGQMQPYEKVRQGALAGTTGSRAPSFPGRITGTSAALQATAPPSPAPVPLGSVGAYAPQTLSTNTPARAIGTTGTGIPGAVGTSGVVAAPARRVVQERTSLVTVNRPQSNEGLWVAYLGEKWVSAGEAVPMTAGEFRQVGSYSGYPVFARQRSSEQVIFLPTTEGFVAPYRLKQ